MVRGNKKFDYLKLMKWIYKEKWDKTVEKYTQPIIFSESEVIAIGRSSYGFIYINSDIVKHKSEFLNSLIKALNTINKDEKIIHSVIKKEDLYKGSKMDILPDLLIIPEHGITFSGSFSDQSKGNLTVEGIDDFHQGIHRIQGIYVFNGERVNINSNSDLSIVDIFPTLAQYSKLPIPEVDGKAQASIFEELK